jgi:hypothetical protein
VILLFQLLANVSIPSPNLLRMVSEQWTDYSVNADLSELSDIVQHLISLAPLISIILMKPRRVNCDGSLFAMPRVRRSVPRFCAVA